MATMNKRKRESQDMPNLRSASGTNQGHHDFQHYGLGGDGQGMDDTDGGIDFAAVLSAHNHDNGEVHEHEQHHDHHQHHHEQDQKDYGHDQSHGQPGAGGPSASDTAAAAMAQFHTMTVPQSTEQSFMREVAETAGEKQDSASAEPGTSNTQQQSSFGFGGFDMDTTKDTQGSPNGDISPTTAAPGTQSTPKPQVGSDEWHKVRKDNHKEVERRRRETINEGITELAKIVPGCEKNKGSILARSVQFITQLKENETQNIEKWTLEKLLTEQAIAELSSSCDKLKAECQRAWAECEQWKKAATKAGVSLDNKNDDDDAE